MENDIFFETKVERCHRIIFQEFGVHLQFPALPNVAGHQFKFLAVGAKRNDLAIVEFSI